jgi:spermidine synthase
MPRPFETLESVSTPEGPLELRKRGDRDFLICIAGRVLMTSVAHRSEDALAQVACNDLVNRRNASILIGGLGMGFTLRAALDVLAADAKVTVAELNEVVAQWCTGPIATLTGAAARDPRVSIVIGNVADVIARAAKSRERYDAIAIDLYEGPHTRIKPSDELYGPAATARVFQALRPGARYAVWCEQQSLGFEQSLRNAGFRYDLIRSGRGARIHFVYVADRPST